jgi:hypothetical protein
MMSKKRFRYHLEAFFDSGRFRGSCFLDVVCSRTQSYCLPKYSITNLAFGIIRDTRLKDASEIFTMFPKSQNEPPVRYSQQSA